MNDYHDILTLTEVAAYLRIHTSTVYRLAKTGKIPAFRIGSDWRFKRSAIDDWRVQLEVAARDRSGVSK